MSVKPMNTIEQIENAKRRLEKATADALHGVEDQSFTPPFSAGIGFYDGVWVAIDDSTGRRVVELRDIEGAAMLVRALNLSAGFRQCPPETFG